MSDRKHTTGPFLTSQKANGNIEITDDNGGVLAEVFGDDKDPHCWPVTANARLFAAAPSLLNALKRVRNIYDKDEDCIRPGDLDDVRAAIAWAEGI